MEPWRHDHLFGQERRKRGEARTLVVVLLTAATMVVEIVAGLFYGSMALLADGLHMASHAAALAIAAAAYVYARRMARDDRFSFGTGKVNALAGYTGAVLLALFAALMAVESVRRLVQPVAIAFDQALLVAVLGLLVNGVSVAILGAAHDEADDSGHHHDHQHDHSHDHQHPHPHDHHHDHNLRSAYLHVAADALTSLLAIVALLAGKYGGWHWLDPLMGIIGAALVARWSLGLLSATSRVLLDRQGPPGLAAAVRESLARDGDEVADLHLWVVAPGQYGLIVSVVSDRPKSPAAYRAALPDGLPLAHVTIEVWRRSGGAEGP